MEKVSSCKNCHWKLNLSCKFPGEIDIVDGQCSGWKLKKDERESFYETLQSEYGVMLGKEVESFICFVAQKLYEKGLDRNSIKRSLAKVFFAGNLKYAEELMVYLPREENNG